MIDGRWSRTREEGARGGREDQAQHDHEVGQAVTVLESVTTGIGWRSGLAPSATPAGAGEEEGGGEGGPRKGGHAAGHEMPRRRGVSETHRRQAAGSRPCEPGQGWPASAPGAASHRTRPVSSSEVGPARARGGKRRGGRKREGGGRGGGGKGGGGTRGGGKGGGGAQNRGGGGGGRRGRGKERQKRGGRTEPDRSPPSSEGVSQVSQDRKTRESAGGQ